MDKEKIIKTLQECERWYTPAEWRRERKMPSASVIRQAFGGWAEAWLAAGYGEDQLRKSQKNRRYKEIQDQLRQIGTYHSIRAWDDLRAEQPDLPHSSVVVQVFGSWRRAWMSVNIESPSRSSIMTKEHIREEALRFIREYPQHVSVNDWDALYEDAPTSRQIIRAFGSWTAFWLECGVDIPQEHRKGREGYTEEEIVEIVRQKGQYYTKKEWDQKHYLPSSRTITKHFPSWQLVFGQAGILD